MAGSNVRTSAATNARERELIITRLFDALCELVFKAFTEPQRLMRWWGRTALRRLSARSISARADRLHQYFCG
jgi:uncharacterized protein YndB with AHSA1/START domain